jgi:hypothetical protein
VAAMVRCTVSMATRPSLANTQRIRRNRRHLPDLTANPGGKNEARAFQRGTKPREASDQIALLQKARPSEFMLILICAGFGEVAASEDSEGFTLGFSRW